MAHVVLKLTPRQARYLWAVVDGAIDAGACSDGSGNTPDEQRALGQVMDKLLPFMLEDSKRRKAARATPTTEGTTP